MAAILAEDEVPVLPPPPGTQTADGFLAPECYAEDATHANAEYGRAVLQQVLEIAADRPALRHIAL